MTKHTPGPWRVGSPNYYCTKHKIPHPGPPECEYTFQGWIEEDFYISSEVTKKVLIDPYGNEDGEPFYTAADARLIAAAPDLLEAAKEALNGMDGGLDDSSCHNGICTREECYQCKRVDNLRAAIAKAEE